MRTAPYNASLSVFFLVGIVVHFSEVVSWLRPARPRTRSRPVPVRPRRPAPAAGGPGPPGYYLTRAFGASIRSWPGSFEAMGDSTTTYDHHYVHGLGPLDSTDYPAPLRTFVGLPRLPNTPISCRFPIDVRCQTTPSSPRVEDAPPKPRKGGGCIGPPPPMVRPTPAWPIGPIERKATITTVAPRADMEVFVAAAESRRHHSPSPMHHIGWICEGIRVRHQGGRLWRPREVFGRSRKWLWGPRVLR